MNFNLKRYYYSLIKWRFLFLLLAVIPILHICISAVIPDRYRVSQHIAISDETPVALLANPVGHMTFRELRNRQSEFFFDSYAIRKLEEQLNLGRTDALYAIFNAAIQKDLSIKPAGNNLFRIEYYGKYLNIGETLVKFYSKRLQNRVLEGQVRSSKEADRPTHPELLSTMEISKARAIWRSERFIPVSTSFFITLCVILMLTAIFEYSDSSFKSERQIARYTNLPILGNVPDLNKLYSLMNTDIAGTASS